MRQIFSVFFPFRLEKGVIVYICDSRGVRDIYETDGSNVIAASEPLAVLVSSLVKCYLEGSLRLCFDYSRFMDM